MLAVAAGHTDLRPMLLFPEVGSGLHSHPPLHMRHCCIQHFQHTSKLHVLAGTSPHVPSLAHALAAASMAPEMPSVAVLPML